MLVATGPEPWLDVIDLDASRFAGHLVELTYRASLLDEPARPIFRFSSRAGHVVDQIGAAPVAGAAVWIGRFPADATHLAISPTNRLGPFAFRIETLRTRAWPTLVLESARVRPRQTRSAILTRCIGWRPESDNNLAWATGATDDDAFDAWVARRARPLDLGGIDLPRFDWKSADRITVVIRATGDNGALSRTLASLDAQAFSFWDALVFDAGQHASMASAQVTAIDLDGAAKQLGGETGALVFGPIEAGDTLPAYALAFVAEQHRQCPSVRLFYGDEIAAGRPCFKAGWSPRFLAQRPYIGRAVCVTRLDTWSADQRRAFLSQSQMPKPLTAMSAEEVKPLRRVLLVTQRTGSSELAVPLGLPSGVASEPTLMPPPVNVRAAIIVLTCDQPALLSRAVASVRAKSPAGSYRMVIVDNGQIDGPARDVLAQLERDPDVLLLRRPGRFNFSAFCNEAVAVSDEPLLVFLNDDTEVLSDAWLERLAAHALCEDVGAVGAKLTFPDGRLQHVGVLVGMGGSAGHLGAMAAGDDPGWLGRNSVVHEVSAVTGACLAVAREKFLAVAGFDAIHLPVELSDVDLCLKLNARGWQTLVDPQVHLMHEESASRGGATFRRLDQYGEQRAVFIERWQHVLRDDPTFHPGLSLYSLQAALG